jgi:energy-coupling factor transporter transmembrane protein EcfT
MFPVLSNAARPWLAIAIFIFSYLSFVIPNIGAATVRNALPPASMTVLMMLWAT